MIRNLSVQHYFLAMPFALILGFSCIHVIDASVGGSGFKAMGLGFAAYETDMGRYPRKRAQVLADFDGLGELEQFPITTGNTLPAISGNGFTGNGILFDQNDTTEFGRIGADFKETLGESIVQFDVRVNGPTGGDFVLFDGYASNPFDGTAVEPTHLSLHVTDGYSNSPTPVTDIFGDSVSGDLWSFSVNGAPNETLNLEVGTWYGLVMFNNTADPSMIDLHIVSDGREAKIGTFASRNGQADLGFITLGTEEPSAYGNVSYDDFAVASVPEPSSIFTMLLMLTGLVGLLRRLR